MKKIALLLALVGVLLLSACGGSRDTVENSQEDASSTITESQDTATASGQKEQGTTETFSYGEMSIEVTNVSETRTETMTDDGGENCEYSVFVCYPGATATILDANMWDGSTYEDGLPHARWGFCTLPNDEKLRITDEMVGTSVDVADMRGVIDLESSIFVLMFETTGMTD